MAAPKPEPVTLVELTSDELALLRKMVIKKAHFENDIALIELHVKLVRAHNKL